MLPSSCCMDVLFIKYEDCTQMKLHCPESEYRIAKLKLATYLCALDTNF